MSPWKNRYKNALNLFDTTITGYSPEEVAISCAAPAPPPAAPPAPAPAPAPPEVKPIELRFTCHSPALGVKVQDGFVPWARKVEEATDGRVKITMYAGGTIAGPREVLEAVRTGLADIGDVDPGFFPGMFPLTGVMRLPMLSLFKGRVDGRILSGGGINGHIAQKLYETFPEIQAEWADWKLLYLWASNPCTVATVKPVRKNGGHQGDEAMGARWRTDGVYETPWSCSDTHTCPGDLPGITKGGNRRD